MDGMLTRLPSGHRRSLRHIRRMDPNALYYLLTGGVATLVGILVGVLGPIPWWVVTGLGLIGAWAFTWLTALDDVRHPVRSLRILAAATAWPFDATRARARWHDIPLFAPTPEWGGDRRLSGGGVAYDASLLSAARPLIRVTWSHGDAEVSVETARRPPATSRSGSLPSGPGHRLDEFEDEPAMQGLTAEALAAQLRPVAISVDGRRHDGTLLDLSQQGLGWLAEVRLDDQHVLNLGGAHVDPDLLPLVRVELDDLADLHGWSGQ